MRGAPWLATIGMACGLAGTMLWGVFLSQMVMGRNLAQIGYSAAYQTLYDHFSAEPLVVALFITWIVGHLLGYVLLGIALVRSRAVPLWAAGLVLASVPLQMAAYPLNRGRLQLVGGGLVVVASVPAALAMLTRADA